MIALHIYAATLFQGKVMGSASPRHTKKLEHTKCVTIGSNAKQACVVPLQRVPLMLAASLPVREAFVVVERYVLAEGVPLSVYRGVTLVAPLDLQAWLVDMYYITEKATIFANREVIISLYERRDIR